MKKIMTVFGIAVLFLTIEIGLFFIIDYKEIKPLNVSDTSEERVIDDSECATVAIEPDGDRWSLVGPDPYFVYGSVNSYVEDVEVKFTDEQEYTDVVLYYDVGEGFNESYKTSMTLEEGSTYKARLKKNIYNIRVDIENKPVGATITDMDIVIDSDIGNYKFNMNFFCISNIIFLLIFVILTIYELYIKDEKFSLIIVKTIICGLIIGLSECAFFRLPFKDSLIVISFDLLALITSSQFELDENSKLKNPYRFYGCLLACCFIYYLIWAIVIPFNHGPDEHMRYQIPEFIYKYGYLPHGDDARIRENSWGISYAFTPITSYIISAIFMKFTSIFTSDANSLILAARMVSVLSSVGTVFFCIKIGEKIFDNVWKYVFVIAVAIWPQFVFISCYVNNDAFGIMTVAWVTYQIIKGHEENWNLKSCVLLGVAAGLCLISYYNCYGIVAVAALFAVISVLKNKEIENKPKFLFSRILWVALAAFVVCGWWFIRNAIIYDGDFMGLTASGKCAEQYAIDGLKPSQRSTAYNVHMSLKQMMIDNHWLSDVVHSFVGKFDSMSIPLEKWNYIIAFTVLIIGLLGMLIPKKIVGYSSTSNDLNFKISMIIMCIITLLLCAYYSYFNDWQPQGRYCLPALVSLQILVIHGWELITNKGKPVIRNSLATILVASYVLISMYSIYDILITRYPK